MMKGLIFLSVFLCLAVPVSFGAEMQPLTQGEINQNWALLCQIPSRSMNDWAKEAKRQNLNLEQKLHLINQIGAFLGIYGYDDSQTAALPDVPMDRIWRNLQKIILTDSSDPTAICGGIHQLMALMAIKMGLKAKVISGRLTAGENTSGHYMCIVETKKYGLVILDYDGAYAVGSLNFEKAMTIQQSIGGNLTIFSYICNPETSAVVTKVNTREGEKMRQDAGEKPVTESLAEIIRLAEVDLLRMERTNGNGASLSLNDTRIFANVWLGKILGLKFFHTAYRSGALCDYGAILKGTVLRPGIFLDFSGESYRIRADFDYSYQSLSTEERINNFHIFHISGEATKLFRLNSAWALNLSGNLSYTFGFEGNKKIVYAFKDLLFSGGLSALSSFGLADIYGGAIVTCEQSRANIQTQDFSLAAYPSLIFGAKLNIDKSNYLSLSTLAGLDMRSWFLKNEATYGNKEAGIEANVFCRLEMTRAEIYVPDAVKIGVGLEKKWPDGLVAAISYEGEIKIWPDEADSRHQFTFTLKF